MRDRSFRTVLVFTCLYGLLGAALMVGQPRVAGMHTADAGGNFEVQQGWLGIQVASAE